MSFEQKVSPTQVPAISLAYQQGAPLPLLRPGVVMVKHYYCNYYYHS
jgi:hypothetical protein